MLRHRAELTNYKFVQERALYYLYHARAGRELEADCFPGSGQMGPLPLPYVPQPSQALSPRTHAIAEPAENASVMSPPARSPAGCEAEPHDVNDDSSVAIGAFLDTFIAQYASTGAPLSSHLREEANRIPLTTLS